MIESQRKDSRFDLSQRKAPGHCGFCESPDFKLDEVAMGGRRVLVLQCAGCNAVLGVVGAE
jgi:hypothetical protein